MVPVEAANPILYMVGCTLECTRVSSHVTHLMVINVSTAKPLGRRPCSASLPALSCHPVYREKSNVASKAQYAWKLKPLRSIDACFVYQFKG